MNEVKLSKFTVQLKDELGWYEMEEIKAVISSGAKLNNSGLSGYDGRAMLDAKLKLFELAITSITDEEGKSVSYSTNWVKALSASDGQTLDNAVDELYKAVSESDKKK